MKFCKFLHCLKEAGGYCLLPVGILICCFTDSFSAFEKLEAGAQPISMGNAIVAMSGSPYAIYYNPAALSDNTKFEIALSHQLLFGMKDLAQTDMIINYSIAGHPFSLAMSQLGNGPYREIQFCAGSKYNITPTCAIGGSIHYYQLSISHYGQQGTWGLNLAIYYDLVPGLHLGAFVTNLNQPRISETEEQLPQTMNLGFSYEPVNELTICFALFRDIHFSQDYRVGLSYQILPVLSFRAGIEDQTNTYNFGLGIDTRWVDFDYALRVHQFLGTSHVFTLMVTL